MIKAKKGDTVILRGFTGIQLGVFEVKKSTDKTLTLLKKDGNKMIFSRKTGKQTNVDEGKERFANSIIDDDGSYVRPKRKTKAEKEAERAEKEEKKKKKAKKNKKKKLPEPVEIAEDEEETVFNDLEDDIEGEWEND